MPTIVAIGQTPYIRDHCGHWSDARLPDCEHCRRTREAWRREREAAGLPPYP